MKNLVGGAAALIGAVFVATMANASTVVVTPGYGGWSNPPAENISSGGGGSAAITTDSARSGAGSVELHGDRTRWVLGDLYDKNSNLGLFTDFTDLAFEYRIDPLSTTSCCDPKYSPALRLVVWDGNIQYDFVWEQAYQAGAYGAAGAVGTWNTVASGGTFYKNPADGDQRTLASWAGELSADAHVSAVYIGVGSGIGAGYAAYVDNITAGGTTYNFEPVPEPATWAMLIMGFGAVGSAIRRRRVFAQA